MNIYQPKQLEEEQKKKLEDSRKNRDELAIVHSEWVKSQFYPYVMDIIKQWSDDQDSAKRFTVDTIATAKATDIKNMMIMAKKIQVEAEELVKRLS